MQTAAQKSKVLVTGAGGAIGSVIAQRLRRENHPVVALLHRDQSARAVLENCGCTVAQGDVSDENAVETLWRAHQEIGAAVHAAAVACDGLMSRQASERWQTSLRVNADGAFLMTRAALRYLPRGGRLILLASRVGQSGGRGQSAYAAAKAATLALMRVAAREGGAQGIGVNAICPGFTPSLLSAVVPEQWQSQRERDAFGALGEAATVAALVSWLLHEDALPISGQIFYADARLA